MDTTNENTRDLKSEFKELPLENKVGTLFELEMITMSEAFQKVADTTATWGKKLFDALEDCCTHQERPESTTPAE